MDGKLYAWRHDGSRLDGFPVRVSASASADGPLEKLVSTPSVGDIDGDGRPEILVGTNGLHDGFASVYAIRADGGKHPDGPFLPGWDPFELPALRPDLLPTLANGVQMSPALVDVDSDGDQEVVLYAVTGTAVVLVDQPDEGPPRIVTRFSLVPGESSDLVGHGFIGGTGSPLVSDTDGDGRPELYAPLLPLRILTLRTKPGVPLDAPLGLGGWEFGGDERGDKASMLPGFPRRMEDLMILTRPSAADVDGDGAQEVLMSSGGYLLHAFDRAGGEADGFPKFTGGWIFSAPGTGDLEGDGRLDVVAVTREGYLFAWEAAPPPGSASVEVSGPRSR